MCVCSAYMCVWAWQLSCRVFSRALSYVARALVFVRYSRGFTYAPLSLVTSTSNTPLSSPPHPLRNFNLRSLAGWIIIGAAGPLFRSFKRSRVATKVKAMLQVSVEEVEVAYARSRILPGTSVACCISVQLMQTLNSHVVSPLFSLNALTCKAR